MRVSARTVAFVLAALTLVYLAFIAGRAWALIGSGDPVPVVLGLAILALPVIGVWVVWRELSFGLRTAELGRAIAMRRGGRRTGCVCGRDRGRLRRGGRRELDAVDDGG